MTVYIITRNRYENLKKIVPRWIDQRIPVTLVVDRLEKTGHESLVRRMKWANVSVINPPRSNQGVGYIRRFAVNDAGLRGYRSIIMSDDDMRPVPGSNMRNLLLEATKPDVLGIGATRTLHDWFSGGVTKNLDVPILCPAGWGMQLFALNTLQTQKVGNFDPMLDCWGEDHELMRNGIKAGIPWLVHCGVKCDSIGARYDPGGMNALLAGDNRETREMKCRRIIHGRWPEYVSNPHHRPRMRWAKMLDDYIPGWRQMSAIHGGSL